MSGVMKKALLLLLALMMVVSMVACEGTEPTKTPDSTDEASDNDVKNEEHTHDWAPATCTDAKVCKICRDIEGKPLGHDWEDATCTEPRTCKTCGTTDGRALGHDFSDADCTTPATCKDCGITEGEALGHSYGDWVVTKEPTETEAGAKEKTCATCGDVVTEEIPKTGVDVEPCDHDFMDATCTAPKTCPLCGATEGKPLGHTYGDWVCIKEATDTEAGLSERSCSVCGAKMHKKIPALHEHVFSTATCTEAAICECGIVKQEAYGHDMLAATCTDPSTCTRCGYTEGAALGHDVPTASCDSVAICNRCGEVVAGNAEHLFPDDIACGDYAVCQRPGCGVAIVLQHIMAPATCTLPSMCLRPACDHTEGKALGHDFSGELFIDDAGHWNVCLNGCGTTNKVAHTYGDWEVTKEATATEAGSKTKACACGHSVTVEILPVTPEEAPEVTTPEIVGNDFTLATDSTAQFVVISKNSLYDSIAENLAAQLTAKTGITFTFRKVEPTTGNKIYVGYTPANLMTDVARLSYSGYVFRASGNNIHITAHSKAALQSAVNAFVATAANADYWTTGGADGSKISIKLPGSVLKTYNPESYPHRDANLLGKHISNYVIVLPKNYSVNERFMVEALIDQIGRDTGYKLNYISANVNNTNPYRIVMGEGTSEYSATLYDGLADGSYRIKSEGTCVYVAYDNYLVATDAYKALCELYKTEPISSLDEVGYPDYSQKLIHKKDPSHIRIMTTNIVAPGDDGGRAMEARYGITWKNRMQMQGEAIMLYLPDFVGFQELQQGKVNGVTAAAHTEILKTIGDEYEMVYYDGLAKSSHWTPIAYRKSVWQVEDKAYNDVMDSDMHRWQWALFSMIDDPTTAENESEIKYIVMNLHYPISSKPAERVLAGQSVNAEFKRLKELYPDIPISITGDFNAEFASELFNLTVDGTDLKTGYMATADYGTEGRAAIDHVLIEDDDVTVYAYRMLNEGNLYMTSDHKPVFVDVAIGKIILPTPGPDSSWDDEDWVTPEE